jgi:HAD superfamily hydrolase (TIGR01509 family)
MNKLKAILFDHDGTLVNSEYIHYLHWKRVMDKYSKSFHLETYIKNFTGVPTMQNALDLITMFNLNEDPEKLINDKAEMSQISLTEKEYKLMPYALETVEFFKQKNLSLCVVSGSNHNEVVHSIDNQNMLKYFDFIVGGDDVENSKPAPDVYLKALADLGLKAAECIAVEDTSSGIKAAKDAGVKCIGVKSEYSATQDFSAADVVFNNLNEAKEWIEENLL